VAQQPVADLVPRVRRAVEGPRTLAEGDPDRLTDEQAKYLVADTIASILLYTGGKAGLFGKTLIVTATDGGVPTDYAVDPELSLEEQTVLATQAALDYFFHEWKTRKISETISDEAQTYEYQLSAQLTRDQLRSLRDERDRALEALEGRHRLDDYVSFIAERDMLTSREIEPWLWGAQASPGGYDARFGGWG
jgi:hypothetical protein